MANRRMISKSISTSVKLARVSDFAALLFTWIIPLTDDYGRMDGEPLAVRGIVVPMRQKTDKDIQAALDELKKEGLIIIYEVDGGTFLEIPKFYNHQTLKNDRGLVAEVPPPKGKQGIQRNPKDSKGFHSVSYLSNIPKEDMAEFVKRFVATDKEVAGKAEDLKLYCESKGRVYKNYRSFLLNALKKDFKERAEKGGKYKGL